MANVNIDELEKYCTQEGISNFGKMQTDETRESYEYHRGLATAFFWVTACIQNGVIPKKDKV